MNILEARRRTLGGHILKKTAQGNPAIATDSLARRYPGITMQGWTEQAKTTGAQLFDASKIPSASAGGATLVNNGDGSFTISGEGKLVSSFSSMVNLSHDETVAILRAGDLYINAGQSGEPYLTVSIQNDSESIEKTFSSYGSATGKINVTEDDLADEEIYLRYGFYGRAGRTISNHTISPMLYQSGSGTWEPYTGGAPSPSPDYPQEIVSAGTQNQENGKWEYEITITNEQTDPDKNQTVTLTADRPLTKWDRLEKRNGQWGWVYKSNEKTYDGSADENWLSYANSTYRGFQIDCPDSEEGSRIEGFCDKFPVETSISGTDPAIWIIDKTLYFKNVNPKYASSVEEWKTWLQSNNIKALYQTAAETFVPLTTAEQEAMNALHTYRPTTVLSNQQDCDMTLTYKSRKGMS